MLNISITQNLKSDIIILSKCDDKQDEFLKNEYIFNLDELIMIRNYVYKEKTYQKYRLTDLSVKKSNSISAKSIFTLPRACAASQWTKHPYFFAISTTSLIE